MHQFQFLQHQFQTIPTKLLGKTRNRTREGGEFESKDRFEKSCNQSFRSLKRYTPQTAFSDSYGAENRLQNHNEVP